MRKGEHIRLLLESVAHTVLVPGVVIAGLPYLLLSSNLELYAFATRPLAFAGVLLILAGAGIALWCTRHFIVVGGGTPNPLDPPKFLVRAGPYQLVRNPMYVSLGLVLAGEALVLGSGTLLVYLMVVMLCCHLVVVLYEEPALRRLFGSAFEEYCARVPRWAPGIA